MNRISYPVVFKQEVPPVLQTCLKNVRLDVGTSAPLMDDIGGVELLTSSRQYSTVNVK